MQRSWSAITVGWSATTDFGEVCLRAGGRARYNNERRMRAELRRSDLTKLWCQWDKTVTHCMRDFSIAIPTMHGFCAMAARKLGVHRSTICRDMRTILRECAERERLRAVMKKMKAIHRRARRKLLAEEKREKAASK